MKKQKSFPFERARRITEQEVRAAKQAIEAKLNIKRPSRGRPPKTKDKFIPLSIRLHPKIVAWAKKEAKKEGVGYQTIINRVLLKKAA